MIIANMVRVEMPSSATTVNVMTDSKETNATKRMRKMEKTV